MSFLFFTLALSIYAYINTHPFNGLLSQVKRCGQGKCRAERPSEIGSVAHQVDSGKKGAF